MITKQEIEDRRNAILAMHARNPQLSHREIASSIGCHHSVVHRALSRAKKLEELPDGVHDALRKTGLSIDVARGGYRRVESEDGSFNTVFWRIPDEEKEDLMEAIHEAFTDIPEAVACEAPDFNDEDLCTFYLIVDHHLAMHAWGRQTGESYDLSIGLRRLRESVAFLVDCTPPSEVAVILNLGDFFHADTDEGVTPASKHKLDVDGRYYKVIESGVQVTVECIEQAKKKHKRVIYRALRGNHDPHAHVALTIALRHHYRSDPRVTIEGSESDFFHFRWGRCMVVAHHGDRAKPEQLVHYMADAWSDEWGHTRWRYMWTGHIHHDRSRDIGGAKWESFRTLAAKDAWAAGGAYSTRQSMNAVSLHKIRGEVMRNTVNITPEDIADDGNGETVGAMGVG